MKKVLTVVWHLSFVIFMTLLLQLTLFSGVSVKSFKGDTNYKISLKDYSNSFVESDMFNQMFGVSVSDILNYGALNYEYDNTPELHNSVSANSIGGGDVKGNLGKYKDILGSGNTNLNYYINAVIDGDVVNGTVMAGQIAGLIKEEKTCKEIIESIMKEASDLLKK